MGLDMNAYAVSGKLPAPVDFELPEGSDVVELQYWRKHPNLHGWMETLYREKGGVEETFNCSPVELTAEDLDRLERAIKNRELPPTSGFFFGASDGSEIQEDLAFVAAAREAIAAGKSVFYDSWW